MLPCGAKLMGVTVQEVELLSFLVIDFSKTVE
jgi:hypothetical protein